jgi:nitrous oxide reductase accessory protein NosL
MRVLLPLIVLAAIALANCQPTEVTSQPAPTDGQEQAVGVGDAITLQLQQH